MAKRILIDIGVGALLLVVVTGFQYGAYLLALAWGLPMAYESAPEDPLSASGWLDQVNAMMLIAAVPTFVVSFVLARLLRIVDPSEGLRRGLIWTAVVAVAHVLIGLGNGTVGMFTGFGPYVMLMAVWLGPIVAGWLRGRSAHRGG